MPKMIYVGLDVHAYTIAAATADEGRDGEARFWGTISNNGEAILRLTKQLSKENQKPEFCDEAGPCSYGIYGLLNKLGFICSVVSPSMIPRKARTG